MHELGMQHHASPYSSENVIFFLRVFLFLLCRWHFPTDSETNGINERTTLRRRPRTWVMVCHISIIGPWTYYIPKPFIFIFTNNFKIETKNAFHRGEKSKRAHDKLLAITAFSSNNGSTQWPSNSSFCESLSMYIQNIILFDKHQVFAMCCYYYSFIREMKMG